MEQQQGSAACHCCCCAALMEVWEARGEESVSMSAGRSAVDLRKRQQDRNVNRADLYLLVRGNLLHASALLFAQACVPPPPSSLLRNTGRVIPS